MNDNDFLIEVGNDVKAVLTACGKWYGCKTVALPLWAMGAAAGTFLRISSCDEGIDAHRLAHGDVVEDIVESIQDRRAQMSGDSQAAPDDQEAGSSSAAAAVENMMTNVSL